MRRTSMPADRTAGPFYCALYQFAVFAGKP
jgi:hypothetical protein